MPWYLLRRLLQLLVGLILFGISLALVLRAGLGLAPWDVLHQGVAQRTGLSIGSVVIAASFVVLLLWLPLRERPGVGTLANAVLVGIVVDGALGLIPDAGGLLLRVVFLLGGVLLCGLASALYIGASLGPGPRDGLMTGLVRRTGRSVRLIRTLIEATVLVGGWLLGGTVGVGTVLYALAIGPLTHALLPRFTLTPDRGSPDPPGESPAGPLSGPGIA